MLPSPSLKDVPRYPVTAGLAAAAIIVTVLWWRGQSIDVLIMDGHVWAKWQLWRALTSTLPHVNFFHLAFNLYWLWKFGSLIEGVYGHLKCAGIYVLLGLGSSLAEFTVFSGGVGLSGIGYGLWGMLWVLERRNPRFAGVVDQRTSQTFVIWFFLCIVLTVTNVMAVANVAHGAGAILGGLLGLAMSSEGVLRMKSVAGIILCLSLGLAGSAVYWPWVNLSEDAESEVERVGLEELEQNHLTNAVRLLEISTQMRHAPARAWYNLGVTLQQMHRHSEAVAAFEHAAQMPDADTEMRKAARETKTYEKEMEALKEWQRQTTNPPPIVPLWETNR
jgi:membrane associated rhomboid family serine protease